MMLTWLVFWLISGFLLSLHSANAVNAQALVVRLPESIFNDRADGRFRIHGDIDRDGLKDKLEAFLAEEFKPYFRFDPDEHSRRPIEPIVLFQVRPIECVGAGCSSPVRIAIRWAFLFLYDGGYNSTWLGEGDFSGPGCRDSHAGDNDFATFVLTSSDTGLTWSLAALHLGGDSGIIKGKIIWPHPDRSPPGTGAHEFEFDGTHPIIYMSNGKHHLYLHARDWGDSPYSDAWPDACGDDMDANGPQIKSDLRSVGLPNSRYNNVGEPEHNAHPVGFFVNDLTHLFSETLVRARPSGPFTIGCSTGRHAWSPFPFCSNETRPNKNLWLTTAVIYKPARAVRPPPRIRK